MTDTERLKILTSRLNSIKNYIDNSNDNKNQMELEMASNDIEIIDLVIKYLNIFHEKDAYYEDVQEAYNDLADKFDKVLNVIFQYGQIDGAHHKAWVIDQIVRILQGKEYTDWVYNYEHDEQTGDTYTWDTGIAP